MVTMLMLALAVSTQPSSLSTSPPVASVPESTDEITVTGKQFEENRRVCVGTVPTGSIMRKKVCKTVAQWRQEKEANQRLMNQTLREQAVQQTEIVRCMRNAGATGC